jgi:aminotransferase
VDSRTGSQVLARFMGMVMGGRARFEPSQMVLTAGATPVIEILAFSLAQPGEAFLIPSPYYSGYVAHFGPL